MIAGIDFRMSRELGEPANPLRAAVTLWARAMDSMLRLSPNATLRPRNIECTAPRQTKWNNGQLLLRFCLNVYIHSQSNYYTFLFYRVAQKRHKVAN